MNAVLKSMLPLAVCALAAGCATPNHVDPKIMQLATAPLTCANQNECDAWWQRAEFWVSQHSTYKLQTVTDSVIQTAGPSGGTRALAYQVTRTPDNHGGATIGFAAHCNDMQGCEPNPWVAGADFKQFVRHGSVVANCGTPAAQLPPARAPAVTR